MIQILVQLDEEMARALERVVPAKSRKRSRFIRLAIERALMELGELGTREAYRRLPDDEPHYFNPDVWSEWAPKKRSARAKRKR